MCLTRPRHSYSYLLTYYIHCRHLLLLSPKADTVLILPEGWVDLDGWAIYPDGLPVRKQSPIQVVTGLSVD